MEYPTAMTFEIHTPFILPQSLFKGFNVTHNTISYRRNGLGKNMNHPSEGMFERYALYDDYFNNITPKIEIKVLTISPIWIYSAVYAEHIEFEVILNRYSVTPTEALTYKLFRDFVKNINKKLSLIKKHPLKDIFIEADIDRTEHFHRHGIHITTDGTFISLPDLYIPVTDTEISEKGVDETIHYMDALKEYYQRYYNENIKEDESSILNIPGWNDSEEEIA